MVVQIEFIDGMTIENHCKTDSEAAILVREVLENKDGDYRKVRAMKDDGEFLLEEMCNEK